MDILDFSPRFNVPLVGLDYEVNWLRVSLITISLVADVISALRSFKSNFYYFMLSKAVCHFVSAFLVIIDEAGNLGIFNPTKPWIRYA